MQRLLSRLTAALEPERRLSLRDDVAREPRAIRRSFWAVIADRYGAFPLIFAFIAVSIGFVAVAIEFLYAMARLV